MVRGSWFASVAARTRDEGIAPDADSACILVTPAGPVLVGGGLRADGEEPESGAADRPAASVRCGGRGAGRAPFWEAGDGDAAAAVAAHRAVGFPRAGPG